VHSAEADSAAAADAIGDGLQEAAHRWLDPTLPRVRFVADTSVVRRWSDAK
jgi:DNA polymerase I